MRRIVVGVVVGVLAFCGSAKVEAKVDMDVIAKIETGGESAPDHACSFRGCEFGRGRFQVSETVLEEWNNYHSEWYEPSDLFIPSVNRKVAEWYMNKRIPQMLRYFGRDPDSVPLMLVAYNAGIRYALKEEALWPRESVQYVKVYERLVKVS